MTNPIPRCDFIAQSIIDEYSLIFDPVTQELRVYRDGVWRIFLEDYIKNITYQILTEYPDILFMSSTLKDVVEFCKAIAVLPEGTVLNSDRNKLVLKNCVYDLLTGETSPHSKELYSTILLPINWNPEASCPRWMQYLDEVFESDPELIAIAQELMGYCLSTSTQFQVSFFLLGEGSDGKSVYLKILQEVVGRENVSNIPFNELSNHHQLASLHSKLVNISSEIEGRGVASTNNFKAIVSGDYVQADPKFKPSYSLKPTVKIVCAGNTPPKVADKTHGFKRRILVLPFNRSFRGDNADIHLEDKLLTELDGIFIWATQGYQRLIKQGHFTRSKAVDRANQAFHEEMNPLITFIEEEGRKIPGAQIHKTIFRDKYVQWCKDSGYMPLSAGSLTRELERLDIHQYKSNGHRYYLDIALGSEKELDEIQINIKRGQIGLTYVKKRNEIIQRATRAGLMSSTCTRDELAALREELAIQNAALAVIKPKA